MQAPPVVVFMSGLLAGILHVASGPDHWVAMAPLTVRAPRVAGALGAAWGVGHGGGIALWVLVAALGRAWFDVKLEPDLLEALVGLSLVGLGAFSLLERTAHTHSDAPPGHLLAFGVGLLHGSAGASHLLALLPTLGLPAPQVIAYAGGYLCAGVLAMAVAASALGRFSARVRDLRTLRRVCAVLAMVLGLAWIAQALAPLG